jgi:ectoine hydroxylase
VTLVDTRGETGPLDRRDPTVRGSVADGPFDSATLAGHEARGYSQVEGLLSPAEVQTYWQELVRLSSDEALADDERVITDGRSGEVRSVFDVHVLSGLVAELVRDPRVLDRARQLLGSEVYLHQARMNYTPGFKGAGLSWRSDFATWHAEDGMPSPRAVSCSLALTDDYAFNGGLMVVPGSQRGTFAQRPSEDDVAKMAAEHGIEQLTGAAGDALFFDSNLLYGSGNNITPYSRSNIVLVFNSVENALVQPFSAHRPRPGFIAARDFTPLSR